MPGVSVVQQRRQAEEGGLEERRRVTSARGCLQRAICIDRLSIGAHSAGFGAVLSLDGSAAGNYVTEKTPHNSPVLYILPSCINGHLLHILPSCCLKSHCGLRDRPSAAGLHIGA
jgi:hypothetical protein